MSSNKNISIKLKEMPQPSFQSVEQPGSLTQAVYQKRLAMIREKMVAEQVDFYCIYADKEHAANFEYFTGFEPRFEEAMIIIPKENRSTIILGNENIGRPEFHTLIDFKKVHFASFSLISQPRETTQPFSELLKEAGIDKGASVATAGWKYFEDLDHQSGAFEIPHYMVNALQNLVGSTDKVRNRTDWLMHPDYGLRCFVELEQLAIYEYSAYTAAKTIYTLLEHAKPGISELELGQNINVCGMAQSVHPMISFGEKARNGMSSPSNNRAQKSDFLTLCCGLVGALSARGAYIDDIEGSKALEWIEKVLKPYMLAAYHWFNSMKIGETGGEIFRIIEEVYPKDPHGWGLNPGHLIAFDEWVSTPIYPNSQIKIRSGQYFQFDLIAGPKAPLFGGNMEDGVYFADSALRKEIEQLYPDMYQRMQNRRRYMASLGYDLPEECLPMSDITGFHRPLTLSPEYTMTIEKQ